MEALHITDGIVTIRSPRAGDAGLLVAGRDAEFHRFLGEGSPTPNPTACIEAAGEVVGWVDVDVDPDQFWLLPGEVNMGYHVFAEHRGRGYGTRALQLLVHHLALDGRHRVATLLIDPANHRSQALARRAGFARVDDLDGNPYFKRDIPPLSYSDGTVTIRRRSVDDLDADLGAKDDEQLAWLWTAAQRATWAAMTADERRDHARRGLEAELEAFGHGAKWMFAVDAGDGRHVAQIDADLANGRVPPGVANIAYAAHPDHRGHGYVSRAVRLVQRFLREHTGTRQAQILVDEGNEASHRVARSVGATIIERWTDEDGTSMVRYHLDV